MSWFKERLNFWSCEFISDPESQLVIDDVSCWFKEPTRSDILQSLQDLEDSCRGRLRVLSLSTLANELDWLVRNRFERGSFLVVFPGDGAKTTKQALPEQSSLLKLPSISVEARRIKDAQGVVQGIALPGAAAAIREALAHVPDPRGVVVVDDVIDTGQTLSEIKSNTGIDKIPWYALTPIMLSLRTPTGFDKVYAASILRGAKNPVDLNSLTSFVEGGRKTDRLIDKCSRSYISNSADELLFSRSLDQLRKFYLMTQEQQK